MLFEPGGLPLGFVGTDCPLGLPVSGSFVSTLVPLRFPRFSLADEALCCSDVANEATEICEESATGVC